MIVDFLFVFFVIVGSKIYFVNKYIYFCKKEFF